MDKVVRFWNTENGQESLTLPSHQHRIHSLALEPVKHILAYGGFEWKTYLINMKTHKQVAVFKGHTDSVTSIALSPDWTFLVTAGRDGVINYWKLENIERPWRTTEANHPVTTVAFSNDGKWLASGGSLDKTVSLWDVTTGKRFVQLKGHRSWINRVAFSP